jgi:hypothetical protein
LIQELEPEGYLIKKTVDIFICFGYYWDFECFLDILCRAVAIGLADQKIACQGVLPGWAQK